MIKPEQVIKSEDYEAYALSPEHWSADGTYLYFAPYFQGSIGGYDCIYGFAVGLYRLSLNDGSVSTIASGHVIFAFSPTDRRLAYTDGGNLIVHDLKTGDEIKIDIEEDNIDTLTWSPDGLELAYATCQENDPGSVADGIPKKSAIKIFSIRQNTARTILTMEKRLLSIKAWNADHTLTISSEGGAQGEGIRLFDLKTGQWISATPTP
jgi:WD40 repeat protein